jgi:hypothetical protein
MLYSSPAVILEREDKNTVIKNQCLNTRCHHAIYLFSDREENYKWHGNGISHIFNGSSKLASELLTLFNINTVIYISVILTLWRNLSLLNKSFDAERTWWRLFQKPVVRTELYMYVFINWINVLLKKY